MITLPIIILLLLGAVYKSTYIRKHNVTIYLIATIITIVGFFFLKVPILTPLRQGAIGFATFYVVMLAGALPTKHKLRIAIMKVRMEYSIIGFLLISPHAMYYFIEYLTGEIAIPILGIIAYGIMIPLFITSFKIVRKKMTPSGWKSLQRFAYIVYIGLFVHLILQAEMPNLAVYILLFGFYIPAKLYYELKQYQRKHPISKTR